MPKRYCFSCGDARPVIRANVRQGGRDIEADVCMGCGDVLPEPRPACKVLPGLSTETRPTPRDGARPARAEETR